MWVKISVIHLGRAICKGLGTDPEDMTDPPTALQFSLLSSLRDNKVYSDLDKWGKRVQKWGRQTEYQLYTGSFKGLRIEKLLKLGGSPPIS